MLWHPILLPVLLAASLCVSGSETALFSLSRRDLREFAASGVRWKHRAWRIMQNPRRVLTTVLIANTTVNVAIFAIASVVVEHQSGSHPVAASVIGVAVLFSVVIFGELLPKAAAMASARSLAPLAAVLVDALAIALAPVRVLLRYTLVEPATRLLLPPDRAEPRAVSTEELRGLVEMSADRGVIDSRENEMLQAVLTLPETSVRTVMVPRVDVVAVGIDDDRDVVCERLNESGRRKLPVHGNDLDDVRGVIYARDLYLNPDTPLSGLLHPVECVPEQINLAQLIAHFRSTRTQLAIVVDEFGGMCGLVALEDVMEWIVGDILRADEAEPVPATQVIDENTYRLAGNLSVRAWADRFSVPGTTHAVDTLGGLVVSMLGRLPREGDTVHMANLSLTVERMTGRRVDRVLLRRTSASDTPPTEEAAS